LYRQDLSQALSLSSLSYLDEYYKPSTTIHDLARSLSPAARAGTSTRNASKRSPTSPNLMDAVAREVKDIMTAEEEISRSKMLSGIKGPEREKLGRLGDAVAKMSWRPR